MDCCRASVVVVVVGFRFVVVVVVGASVVVVVVVGASVVVVVVVGASGSRSCCRSFRCCYLWKIGLRPHHRLH